MSLKEKLLRALEEEPCSYKALKDRLGNPKKVRKLLDELCGEGKAREENGRYSAVHGQSVRCTLVKLGRGFGFARSVDTQEEFFIPGRFLRGAMPGDTLLVQVSAEARGEGNREGRVLEVTARQDRLVGTIARREDGRLLLIPDVCPQMPVLIKRSREEGAQAGEKAAVQLVARGERHEDHRAAVILRFGVADSAANCARAILYRQNIEPAFSEAALQQARALEGAQVTGRERRGREDLRGACIFTIDGADTKDIDDAVSVERTEYGYRLGVHIADVSHYVQAGSALDADAFRRGTSVYYADQVVPMLPRELSNGICSLNPGEDRLAFSCLMELDCAGRVTDAALKKSVIRSRVKGVYSEVNDLLAGRAAEPVQEKYAEVAPSLALLAEVYEKLAALHRARGAMEIESDEAKFILNEEGRCVDVQKRVRGTAERMIEECMLLANESVAAIARRAKLPFVYRVHPAPEAARIDALTDLLLACGLEAPFHQKPSARSLGMLLEQTRDTPLARAVHTGVLRSMAKAVYSTQPAGHFGLALADYAHFTSPIRRYPDLAIHRILSDWLSRAGAQALHKRYGAFSEATAQQSSEREQAAMTAERDIADCYKAEAMQAHIGEEYEAVVSGVTSFGIYAELPNTVEGLIRSDRLSEHALTLTAGMCLSDPLSGQSWKLGDVVRVRVEAADTASGHVDFSLVR